MRKISFLINEEEKLLLEEACAYNDYPMATLEWGELEGEKYQLRFSDEQLEEIMGCLANRANHERSKRKQARLNEFYEQLNALSHIPEFISIPSRQSKPNQKSSDLNSYIFNVWIRDCAACDTPGKILRKIKVDGRKNLYHLARMITQAFGFFFDHCFGFYDNFERYHDSKKSYELFHDIGEESLNSETKGVYDARIAQAFKEPGEKMIFLFDYGDGWQFVVELVEIQPSGKAVQKSEILERMGKAPEQYPPCK